MWLSSSSSSCAVLRRQLFLIRSLGDSYTSRTSHCRMERAHCSSFSPSEADAEGVIRKITPVLDRTRYKGQAGTLVSSLFSSFHPKFHYRGSVYIGVVISSVGKIAVIGGCREYTGAPYFTAISALKIVSQSPLAQHVFLLFRL